MNAITTTHEPPRGLAIVAIVAVLAALVALWCLGLGLAVGVAAPTVDAGHAG